MRLVVQRVNNAKVSVDGEIVGEIGKGLFILVGVGKEDAEAMADKLAAKLSKLRVMGDSEKKMNKTVSDVDGSFLIVSQFTLYADTRKGNRPSFVKAGEPELAERLYNRLIGNLREAGETVKTGKFGAYMDIDVAIDGPVTILIEE